MQHSIFVWYFYVYLTVLVQVCADVFVWCATGKCIPNISRILFSSELDSSLSQRMALVNSSQTFRTQLLDITTTQVYCIDSNTLFNMQKSIEGLVFSAFYRHLLCLKPQLEPGFTWIESTGINISDLLAPWKKIARILFNDMFYTLLCNITPETQKGGFQ